MTEFARQFDQRFVGFRAAVAEKDFARPGQPDDPLRQPALPFVVVEIGTVDEDIGLPGQRFPDGGMRMAQAVDRDAAAQVEIFPALVVPDMPALAPRQRESPVDGRHDIPVIKRLNLRAHGSLRRSGG